MNIKNYTSSTPAGQTIAIIEAYLADCGVVDGIAKEIKAGVVTALFFRVVVDGRSHTIRLPAQVDAVKEYLWKDYCVTHRRPRKMKEDFGEQALRTAWKIQLDWVQVQMSLVKLKQADVMQLFLSFIWDGSQTYYDYLRGNKFKALPAATES